MSTKINILTADLLRIMRNISRMCSDNERVKHIQHFIQRMQYSGYTHAERVMVYQKAKKRYETIIEKDKAGTTPLYRSKSWNRAEREKTKRDKRRTWYVNGDQETVLFVDSTPNSVLAKQFRSALMKHGLRIRVVEKSGRMLKSILCRSDPFANKNCGNDTCAACATGTIGCKVRDTVYKITCDTCNDTYIGETSRSVGERFNEHLRAYRNKKRSSVFAQHVEEVHEGVMQPLRLDVLARCPGDTMKRQVAEAVFIHHEKPPLNAKEEFGNSNICRSKRQ